MAEEKETKSILVEVNLYGGTFSVQMTRSCYWTNFEGKTAISDMRVVDLLENRTFSVKQWGDLPRLDNM